MKKLVLSLALVAVLPGLALAGPTKQEQLAAEYLTISNVSKQVDEVRAQMKESIVSQLDQLPIPPEKLQGLKDQTVAIVDEDMQWDNMKGEYIALYADTFTVEELQEILRFSKSPVGQKLNEKMPVLIEKSIGIGQKHSQQAAMRVRQAVQDFAQQQKAEMDQQADQQKAEPQKAQ